MTPAQQIEQRFCLGDTFDQVLAAGEWSRDDVLDVLKTRAWDLDPAGRLPRSKRVTTPAGLRDLPAGVLRAAPPSSPPTSGPRTLTEELAELERTDPEVAAAAASYDRMVERVLAKPRPAAPDPKKGPVMSVTAQAAKPRLEALEDHLVDAGVIRRDDSAPATGHRDPNPMPAAAGPYVAALSVVELFVAAYQRPLDEPRVRRMVKAWDPRMLGILDVSDRGPGVVPRYAIVNGQHRWKAAGMVGVQFVACNVHEGLTVADEAKLMFELDRSTKKLSGWDQWRARRGAGDPVVATVERIAAAHGLRVDDTGELRSYGTAEKLLKVGGEQLLDNALAVLRAAYGDTVSAYQAPLLMGVGQLLHRHPDLDAPRLTRVLAANRPEQLRSTATALREVDGGPLHELMTRTIAGQYNRTPGPRISGRAA